MIVLINYYALQKQRLFVSSLYFFFTLKFMKHSNNTMYISISAYLEKNEVRSVVRLIIYSCVGFIIRRLLYYSDKLKSETSVNPSKCSEL